MEENKVTEDIESFKQLCQQIKDIDRRNVTDYHQVKLLGRDCYLWNGHVIKSSPKQWNFKTKHELKVLKYIESKTEYDFFPKLLSSTTVENRSFLLIEYFPFKNISENFYLKNQKYKLTRKIIKNIEHNGNLILDELKRLDIIHRDITPDNLLFDPKRNNLILIDFGYAIIDGEEVQTENEDENKLLMKAVTKNLGGHYRKPDSDFSYDTDKYSFDLIIDELKEKSPWVYS